MFVFMTKKKDEALMERIERIEDRQHVGTRKIGNYGEAFLYNISGPSAYCGSDREPV